MERRLGPIGPSRSTHGQASWGSRGKFICQGQAPGVLMDKPPGKIFWARFCSSCAQDIKTVFGD